MTILMFGQEPDIKTENPAHDDWFKSFYSNGHLLRDHPGYLYSLWAWQARSIIEKNNQQRKDNGTE